MSSNFCKSFGGSFGKINRWRSTPATTAATTASTTAATDLNFNDFAMISFDSDSEGSVTVTDDVTTANATATTFIFDMDVDQPTCDDSVVSDITMVSNNFEEFKVQLKEVFARFDAILNTCNTEWLKNKCKEHFIPYTSKMKKQDIVDILNAEFSKTHDSLRAKKIPELKQVCKMLNIKGFTGVKKDTLVLQIMNFCVDKMIVVILEDVKSDETVVTTNVSATAAATAAAAAAAANTLPFASFEETERRQYEQAAKRERAREREQERERVRLREEREEREEEERRQREEEDFAIAKKQEEVQRIKAYLQQQKQEEEQQQKKQKQEQQQQQRTQEKKKKQAIPKNVRMIVWNHYIGEDIIKHRCLCCKKVLISNTSFEVGHVLSEKNNGSHEINNLRPICFSCNHSMGAENMIDFVVKYGLFIG